jgi:tetratricopeptide (TPR) repeat protein
MLNDKLFELIHSLNQAEKRYFKQYLKRHSGKIEDTIYARLFDYVVKTSQYERDILLRKCPFIKKEQLQNIRSRLYKNVQDSLRLFHSEKNTRISIYEMMINIEILIHRGLYTQAIKTLTKTERLAKINEFFPILEEIHLLQERILTNRSKSKKHKENILAIQKKRENISLIKKRQDELQSIKTKSYDIFRIEGRVTRISTNTLGLKNTLAKFDEKFTIDYNSHNEVNHYYLAYSDLLRMEGRFEESIKLLAISGKIYEENESYMTIFPLDYLTQLISSTILLNMLGRFNDSMEMIKKIRALSHNSDNKELQLTIFETAVFFEIEVYLHKREFKKAIRLVENNLIKIEKIQEEIHSVNQQSKYYRIALAYFGSGDLKSALRWVNRILNFDQMQYRKDILSSVQILNLLIHYELKNYGLLQDRLKTTELYLKKIDRWLVPEKSIISVLRGILISNKDESISLSKLLSMLRENNKAHPLDKYFLSYFDFEKWLENKLSE